nr:alanyl-tRNA synthetase [uncultured bacterium]
MHTADIRDRWLNYFGDRGHTVVPSASLVSDDPTVMFTISRESSPRRSRAPRACRSASGLTTSRKWDVPHGTAPSSR